MQEENLGSSTIILKLKNDGITCKATTHCNFNLKNKIKSSNTLKEIVK